MPIGIPPDLRSSTEVWRPKFWVPTIDKVTFICQVSNEEIFRASAIKYGEDPDKDGFAAWRRPKPWWWQDRVFLKFDTQEWLAHEVEHLIRGQFHPK